MVKNEIEINEREAIFMVKNEIEIKKSNYYNSILTEIRTARIQTVNELHDFQNKLECDTCIVYDAWLAQFLYEKGFNLIGKVDGIYLFQNHFTIHDYISIYFDDLAAWDGNLATWEGEINA